MLPSERPNISVSCECVAPALKASSMACNSAADAGRYGVQERQYLRLAVTGVSQAGHAFFSGRGAFAFGGS